MCTFHSKILPEGFHPHTQKSEPYKHNKNTTGKKIKLIQPNSCNKVSSIESKVRGTFKD